MCSSDGRWRIEHDLLGERQVPADALWGIHTLRARESFPLTSRRVHASLIHAYGDVKRACARANQDVTPWPPDLFSAIDQACREMAEGALDEHIVVDALQGGAGTSTNMNVNEVLCNRALILMGHRPGSYDVLHPIDDLNRSQSTNDTYPTALRVALIRLIRRLERAVSDLMEAFQERERALAHVVKVGRTELQDAALTTLGRSMGAFADALARDRWRLTRCEERLRVVNLGGTAIGTGLGAPRRYIFRVVDHLRELTGFGLARAENLLEATQNTDALVEVSGMVRTVAVNVLKISTDLRLLSSGPDAGLGEINLPPRQAGSSIMPGKVNPVIPEAAAQAALRVMSADQEISTACGLANLELSQYLPLVADSLLHAVELLTNAIRVLAELCVSGITANEHRCDLQVSNSTALATALVPAVGYSGALRILQYAQAHSCSLREAAVETGAMDAQSFDRAISPDRITMLGSPDTIEGGAGP